MGNKKTDFFKTINKTSTCWLWTGSILSSGYGRFFINGKSYRAHRYIYELINGEIPIKKVICHKCDIRKCVNPDHLFLGTPKDNVLDMINKGRNVFYSKEMHPQAKLTQKQVDEIKYEFIYYRGAYTNLSKKYNVTVSQIRNIILNKRW